jgi:2-hydroxy-6-oxonona-2,4-dienedioate hydrolase
VPDGADTVRQADAYACLLDALAIDRVGVVGVSMGGPSSLSFALRYPGRTQSLAMISAASHAIPPRPAILAAVFNVFLNDFVFWSLVHLSPSGLLAALGVPMDVQKQLSPGEVAELNSFLQSIEPMSARRNGQNLEQHMSEFDAQQIRKIQAPTIVLHAHDDTLVTYDHAEYTAQNIPGAQLVPLERGGHLALMFKMSAGARAQLRVFLEKYNSYNLHSTPESTSR